MAAKPGDDLVERVVLEKGLLTQPMLQTFRTQAVDSSLFDVLVVEGIIPRELRKELESMAAGDAASAPQAAAAKAAAGAAVPPPPRKPPTKRQAFSFAAFNAGPSNKAPAAPVPPAPAHDPRPVQQAPPQAAPAQDPRPAQPASPQAAPAQDPRPAQPAPPQAAAAVPVDDDERFPQGWPGGLAPEDPSRGGIQDYLRRARQMRASDIHFTVGVPPVVRVNGQIVPFDPSHPAFSQDDTKRIIRLTLTPDQYAHLERTGDLDFCYAFESGGRFRTNVLRERHGLGMVCRVIDESIRTLEELGLPAQSERLTEYVTGLVLMTGPTGCGKTSSMMALVELINKHRPDHIITVEDPIENEDQGKMCQVTQREVGPHTKSFARALRAALRQDPDIIVIGDLRDYETTSMAINASETGHLVFASLPTQDAAKTIDKVLDYFPPEEQLQIRLMVSESLRGIISQQLIPTKDGRGQVIGVELLFNSVAVANIIREGSTAGLINAMQLGKGHGMMLMDDSLEALVNAGKIDGVEAYLRATNKVRFQQYAPK